MSQLSRCLICRKLFNPDYQTMKIHFCSDHCRAQAPQRAFELAFQVVLTLPFLVTEFQAMLQDIPLRALVRRVIWRQGELEFRVREDDTFANVDDQTVVLTDTPLRALPMLNAAWQAVCQQYQVVPLLPCAHTRTYPYPFQHLFRRISHPILLHKAAQHLNAEIRNDVAENTTTPAKTLVYLALYKHRRILQKLGLTPSDLSVVLNRRRQASDVLVPSLPPPNMPYEFWVLLLDNSDRNYSINRATPPENLLYYAMLDEWSVLLHIGTNPQTPSRALRMLANHPDYMLRETAARHPRCPPDMLEQLAQDRIDGIRQAVLENPHCPPTALSYLAQAEFAALRVRVASHPNTPSHVLAELIQDKMAYVREAAAQHPHLPTEAMYRVLLRATSQIHLLRALAKNPHLPHGIFLLLACHYAAEVRYTVAENPQVPLPVLTILLYDEVMKIRNLAHQRITVYPARDV